MTLDVPLLRSDALGVTTTQQPLTPTRILELIGAIPTDA